MDQPPQENPPKDFNKIDLSQLQGFSFGTQWTQDKQTSPARGREDRPRRDGGGDHRDDRQPERRDRRAFRRPATDAAAPGGAGPDDQRARPGAGDRRPHREGYQPGGNRGPGGARGGDFRGQRPPMERGPYDSPYFSCTFYPEDTSFSALAKTIRASCRTFELFEIARTVVGKPDRFVVVVQRKAPGGPQAGPGHAPAAAAKPENAPAAAKPAPLFLSVPDGVPFETEEAAIAHVLDKHIGTFFEIGEVEVDPPKGNFQVVNRCGVTGELLGPPNYHRYTQIIQRHHAAKLARMPFETFRAKIETLREPEQINQWLEKMKRTTRYTWKTAAKAPAPSPEPAPEPAAPAPAAEGSAEPAAAPVQPEAATETAPAAEAPKPAEPAVNPAGPVAAPAAPAGPSFDSIEDARAHLLSHARERVVRPVEHARFHGKLIELLPNGEIRRAIEGNLERQRRFPLDTANALRGRLRREGFTIFKKGSKGVSYVCAVKRKFRTPGQVFSESIGNLISFIEAHPMVKAGELPAKILGIALPEPAPDKSAAPEKPAAPMSIEDRTRVGRLQADLAWLVHEGYVTEFIDGSLFAPPAMVEARKKEIEAGDVDPENFPEAAASAPAAEPAAAAETPAPEPVAGDAPAAEVAQEPAPVPVQTDGQS